MRGARGAPRIGTGERRLKVGEVPRRPDRGGPPNGASRSVSKPNERLSVSTPAASADRTRRLAPAPRGSSGPPRRPRTRKDQMTAVALWGVVSGLSALFAGIAFLIAIPAMHAPQLRIT